MSTIPRFELLGDLPEGRHALQASAGTGKTYALAGLATRFVVEQGCPIAQVLVVTFTRAAAAELRDRIRVRLREVVATLDRLEADPAASPDGGDELLAHLCATDREVRRSRAEAALADFDAATITTIHGFAAQVLTTLGASAAVDPDAVLADDAGAGLREVAVDVYLAASLTHRSTPEVLPKFDDVVARARQVAGNPGIRVVPPAAPEVVGPKAALHAQIVGEVIAAAEGRRRATGVLSFDDVLSRLRDAVADPAHGPAVREVLRSRYTVALIDEFQDTDPVQWEIFAAVFGAAGSGTTLVLVGDPKQAIYAFRGADVHTYLDATLEPGTTLTSLGCNWRSDGALLEALEVLLDDCTFGDDRIAFDPVEPAEAHRHRALLSRDGEPVPPLSLRLALGDIERNTRAPHEIASRAAVGAITHDLVDTIRDLLEQAEIPTDGGHRPARPDDIAVLIHGNAEGPIVRDALRHAGIPAVIARGDNVLQSPAGAQWRWLLEGLAMPSHPPRARTAALSWFFGWTPEQLASASDAEVGAVQEQLARWGDTLVNRGVSELLAEVWAAGVVARVLGTEHGERDMTDLDHIAELLAGMAPPKVGPSGLLAVFDRIGSVRSNDAELDLTARRVESEADAVQILTVYTSKGLEFPIVCCPFLWRGTGAKPQGVVFHDPDTGRRTIDVASSEPWPDKEAASERKRRADEEAVGQNLRVLYVALTRARHHLVVWWTRAQDSDRTALARVLFARDGRAVDPQRFAAPKVDLPPDEAALDQLAPLLAAAGGRIVGTVIGAPAGPVRPWERGEAPGEQALELATLGRVPDRHRSRWSFTTISNLPGRAPLDPVDHTLGDQGADDESPVGPDAALAAAEIDLPPAGVGPGVGGAGTADLRSPWDGIRGGADVGTFVHAVLESVDFAAPDLEAEVRAAVLAPRRGAGFGGDHEQLVSALLASLATPVGPLAEGRSLAGLARADRLDELTFDLPIGEAGRLPSVTVLGALVGAHLPAGDPLHPWTERLRTAGSPLALGGHLTGAVDLVWRVRSGSGPARFLVVDYKTNTLGPWDVPQTLDAYGPDALVGAMVHNNYPMQALLYSVALHRYLRWRVPGYDPAVHLGGVLYLFLRGMGGPATPAVGGVAHGVFSWRPPAALVVALSDLLHGVGEAR